MKMKNRLLVLALVFLAASGFIAWASRPEIVPIRERLSTLPMTVGSWEGRESPEMNSAIRAVLGVDDYVSRIYYNSELLPASLYIGYYESQREGDTIHSPLNCLPGAGWNPAKKARLAVPTTSASGAPREIVINRLIIAKGTQKQLVLYWYQSHGRVVASEYWGKIYTVLDALRTNRTDAALVRVIVPVIGSSSKDERAAEQRGVDFVQSLFVELERFLPS
jgi:EpsI family protein